MQREIERVHQALVVTSRQAGMAEIATNVLHNVGNVLNSVNVSSALVLDGAKTSSVPGLAKAVALLRENENDLANFFTQNPRGKQLISYLAQLSDRLQSEQVTAVHELELLRKNIEHIRDIVMVQQSYATVAGVKEVVSIRDVIEDSIRMNTGALDRHGVKLVRDFADVPPITVDKHKIMQILVNFVRNAKYACDEAERPDKEIVVRLQQDGRYVTISVIDNGVGIPPENLTRIFNHGFTTRKSGHGFGLHSGALAAREMGGSIVVKSDGVGRGASFTLELPVGGGEQRSSSG
jgi:signal transduction histidine kinase